MNSGGLFAAATLVASLAFAWNCPGASPRRDDEDDVEIRATVDQNCLMCHSRELIESQRLTAKQWSAEVDKMIGWGAPLPLDKKDAVVAYLLARYPDKRPKSPPATIPAAEAEALDRLDPMTGGALPKGDAGRGAPLYAKHCATCHGAEGLGGDLGTNIVEKPSLYREAEYVDLMRKGRRRMPGFAMVLDPAGEADVLAWLRGRRTP